MKHKDIIRALPLVADALGRKYGVRVHIGGNKAYTNGQDIHLPSLPLDSDEIALNLARGYLDHEAAHLRSTDFEAMAQAGLTAIEKHIWNILEDVMVERKLAQLYPGCRHNLTWLVKHVFLQEFEPSSDVSTEILNWILCHVRSFDVPELNALTQELAQCVDQAFPGLLPNLMPIISSVPQICLDTRACISTAKELVRIIEKYAQSQANAQETTRTGGTDETQHAHNEHSQDKHHTGAATAIPTLVDIENLTEILHAPADKLPSGFGDRLGEALEKLSSPSSQSLTVAQVRPKSNTPLSEQDIDEARKSTTALRTRLQGLLQSAVDVRSKIGRTGRIDHRRLSRVVTTADSKVFLRKGRRQGVNTAIHILLDASASMQGSCMELASKSCYALGHALVHIPDVSLAITCFPGCIDYTLPSTDESHRSVAPVLLRNEKFHNRFEITPNGSTPMAEALWWVLQEIHPQPEERKIILIISDGDPDSYNETASAISAIKGLGIEVYGIGIASTAMSRLLPYNQSASVNDLGQLAPAMFGILQNAFMTAGR